jgi:hypothetical protein
MRSRASLLFEQLRLRAFTFVDSRPLRCELLFIWRSAKSAHTPLLPTTDHGPHDSLSTGRPYLANGRAGRSPQLRSVSVPANRSESIRTGLLHEPMFEEIRKRASLVFAKRDFTTDWGRSKVTLEN